MPKIVGPPPITNLDGLLDIFTNPEKYVKYLQDLKDLHKTIEGTLAIANTQDAAHELLSQAHAKRREADEYFEGQVAKIQERTQRVSALESKLADDEARFKAQQEAALASLKERERAVADSEKEVARQSADLAANLADVAQRESAMAVREDALKARESKVKQAQDTLAKLM